MGGTTKQLQDMFKGVVIAFNDHDYATVGNSLALGAIVRSVRPQQRPVHGNAEIVAWMETQDDQPTFMPDSGTAFNLDGPEGAAMTATITGMGTWHDKYGTDRLSFTFKCQFNGGGWVLSDLSTIGARPDA